MIDGIPLDLIQPIGTGGIITAIIFMILTRKLVPIGALRDEQKMTTYWREVADRKDATIATLTETNRMLTDGVGKTVEKVMSELQARARDGSDAQ